MTEAVFDVAMRRALCRAAYHQFKRDRGRLTGQLSLREKHEDVVGDWFDYMFLSPAELTDIVEQAGWRVEEMTQPNPSYLAVLRPA